MVCGHYGCGKTNLALNLAVEAASKGRRSVIVDMDIVNPYFRSSEYGPFLERHGVQLIAPVFANTTLDTPVLPPEIYSIFSMEDEDVFIDAGGDDVGATALGRISRELEAAGYEMLYVVNRYRILSTKPEETLPLLREIEGASHLKATAVVNNSHLGVDTTQQAVLDLALRHISMARVAHREGYPEIGRYWEKAAWEEAEHAAKFAELLGEVVTDSTKKNLEMRVEAENGATAVSYTHLCACAHGIVFGRVREERDVLGRVPLRFVRAVQRARQRGGRSGPAGFRHRGALAAHPVHAACPRALRGAFGRRDKPAAPGAPVLRLLHDRRHVRLYARVFHAAGQHPRLLRLSLIHI